MCDAIFSEADMELRKSLETMLVKWLRLKRETETEEAFSGIPRKYSIPFRIISNRIDQIMCHPVFARPVCLNCFSRPAMIAGPKTYAVCQFCGEAALINAIFSADDDELLADNDE